MSMDDNTEGQPTTDDVDGHLAAYKDAPGVGARFEGENTDDVEGHLRALNVEDDSDDVQGHREVMVTKSEDDVEGHKAL